MGPNTFNSSTISTDIFETNITYSNEIDSSSNDRNASDWTEPITATSASTVIVTTTSTSTVTVTTTSISTVTVTTTSISTVTVTTTSTSTVTTTTSVTKTGTTTSDSTTSSTVSSEIPTETNVTSMSLQNTTEPIPPSEKPNLGLILGLSLGLGLPLLIVKCVSPYVQEPSGNCINVLIDINNCGKINNVCPSTYTSCSAGLCSTLSSIKIINGTFIWAASVNGSVDDKYFTISVPFNITLYNTTTTSITVTTNGVICLQSCSTTFTETALPTSAFSGATILPYWDDLYIFANTSQGIYYDKQGNTPNRTFIIEYYCSHYQQSTDYYNFQVVFFENMPGIVQFIYYEVTDEGASATVGIQGNEAKQ
ncbi:unnamed protein product [Rotaria sp. Silwood2]|nr:unnamed protein product [Rotaria sp. Silwood2]